MGLTKTRVLVVEDFPPFRQLISILLKGTEVEVIGEASDGLEAVRLAQQLQPDIVLLDIGLPGLNGIDACPRIRELSPESKIVFVSQESSVDVVQKALALGAKAYVHKGHAHSDLLPAIKAVLRGDRFVSPSLAFNDTANIQPPHQHDILFSSDDAAIVRSLARFIANALNAGNPAIVWATTDHRESLIRELLAQGIDIEGATARGMYMSLDVNDPADRDRTVEVLMRLESAASQMGNKHPRIAVCGERAGLIWAEGKTDEAIQLERLWNKLAKVQDMDILCLYPMPESDAALERICAEHSRVHYLP
jgi:DNA-binding NarL/FixJ family response regulator